MEEEEEVRGVGRKRIRWLAFLPLLKGLELPRVSLNKLSLNFNKSIRAASSPQKTALCVCACVGHSVV